MRGAVKKVLLCSGIVCLMLLVAFQCLWDLVGHELNLIYNYTRSVGLAGLE